MSDSISNKEKSEKAIATKTLPAPPESALNNKHNLWLLTTMIVFSIVFAWLPVLDNLTSYYLNDSITQAGITFATARGIDALISMIQTSSLSLPFFSIDLGQMLDPINDMVEDFSQVMTWILASLMLQKLLFEIASRDLINAVLTLGALLALAALWLNLLDSKKKRFMVKGFILLFSFRFIVLFVLLLNAMVNSLFLDPIMHENQQRLDASTQKVEELQKSMMGLDYQTQLDESLTRLKTLQDEQPSLLEKEQALQPDITQLEQKISAKKSALGWFNSDDELKQFQRELSVLKTSQREFSRAYRTNQKEIESLQDRQQNLTMLLSNDGTSPPNIMDDVSRIKQAASRLSSQEFWTEVEDSSKDLIDAMIESMVNFILKVILMPLLFLWLFKTVMQYIFSLRL